MQGRTFLRTMLDNIFIKNPFCKTVIALVNFCNEQCGFNKKNLKFSEKMPFNSLKTKTYDYKTRFIFDSSKASGASLK